MVNRQTWNFLIDTGMQEQFATPVSWYKSIVPDNNTKIKELTAQSEAPAEQTIRTKEKFFQDMTTVQEREWVTDSEALDLVQNYYKQKGYTIEWVELEEEVIEEPIEDISWLDVWVKTWQAVSEFWKGFKFDSNVDDEIVESGAKFLANLPWNAVQLWGDLISIASDPVWLHNSIKDLWQGLSDKLVFGTLNSIFWQDVAPTEQAIMVDAIWAELEKIASTPWAVKELLVENPADVLLAVTGWLWVAKNVAKSKWLTWLASKLEKVEQITNPINVLKAEWKLITTPIKKASELIWQWVVKTTWLNFDTVKTIVKNPELFKQAETWVLTRQTVADDVIKAIDKKASDISDIGKEYNTIRKAKSNITPDDINTLKGNVNKFLSDNDIVVIEWKLNFDNSQIGQVWNRKAIQDAYNLIENRTKFDTGWDFLNLRQSIDDTINFKSDASTRWESIVRGIRWEIDNIAKDKLTWLKELDAKFAPERWEFNRITKLIRNKDWSLKDNYISTVANITWKGKELKLERLKKILPNVEAQVNALKALEDVALAKGSKVWTYMNAWSVWVWAIAWWIPWAVAAYIITHPSTLVNVLKAYTWSKALINSIVNKVKNGIRLSSEEANIVSKAIQDQAKQTKVWVTDIINQ